MRRLHGYYAEPGRVRKHHKVPVRQDARVQPAYLPYAQETVLVTGHHKSYLVQMSRKQQLVSAGNAAALNSHNVCKRVDAYIVRKRRYCLRSKTGNGTLETCGAVCLA